MPSHFNSPNKLLISPEVQIKLSPATLTVAAQLDVPVSTTQYYHSPEHIAPLLARLVDHAEYCNGLYPKLPPTKINILMYDTVQEYTFLMLGHGVRQARELAIKSGLIFRALIDDLVLAENIAPHIGTIRSWEDFAAEPQVIEWQHYLFHRYTTEKVFQSLVDNKSEAFFKNKSDKIVCSHNRAIEYSAKFQLIEGAIELFLIEEAMKRNAPYANIPGRIASLTFYPGTRSPFMKAMYDGVIDGPEFIRTGNKRIRAETKIRDTAGTAFSLAKPKEVTFLPPNDAFDNSVEEAILRKIDEAKLEPPTREDIRGTPSKLTAPAHKP